MRKKELVISQGIKIEARECGIIGKVIGLMFSGREKAEILLFSFKKPTRTAIHSFFVFYPFIGIWLDEKNRIVDEKIVKPFTLSIYPTRKYCRLIEIPISKKHQKLIKEINLRGDN